ncbi:MAG: MaoC family dehydratase N-terminal domain-containing protein [Rhodospirillales bacterium]|nr:MAG: MaoC family dehydratase N-terminal domain-containing protein [Rhodospirillales bacterium]
MTDEAGAGAGEYAAWLGRKQTAADQVTRQMAHRMAALLDVDPAPLVDGAELPQPWYAALFATVAPQAALAVDGIPERGDFLPPVPLPRRMFAGRRALFGEPLLIGDEVERESEITAIEPKTGRGGAMVFVTILHRISARGDVRIVEEQDVVFREAASGPAKAPPPQRPEGMAVWKRAVTPDATMLFRYSALTFNGHRIHYDADYARGVEGYPDRIVNGGLTTLLLLELARAKLGRPFRQISTRNRRPLYVDKPVTLGGGPSPYPDQFDLWALDADGNVATEITLSAGR